MANTVPPLSIIELDQTDIQARLQNDPYFAGLIPVLLQRDGITEDDIQVALQTMQAGFSAVGSVVIVLMPDISTDTPNAPGPRYWVRYALQVIDWPIVRRQSPGGTGVSAEEICDRVIFIDRGKLKDDGTPANLVKKYGRKDLNEVFLTIARSNEKML